MGRVCECWKVTRSWCVAFALTIKGLSAVPTTGQLHTHTHTETKCCFQCCVDSYFSLQQDQGVGPAGSPGPKSPSQHIMSAHSSGEFLMIKPASTWRTDGDRAHWSSTAGPQALLQLVCVVRR